MTSTPHILLIDDSPEDVRPVLLALRNQGWRISTSHDPRQGLQRALVLRPDLILLDVQMPHLDGFTFCRLLRESEATKHTPVIFLTSASSLEQRLEGLQVGGVDYVLKPYEPLEVLARMRVHLHLHLQSQSRSDTSADDDQTATASSGPPQLKAAVRLINQNLAELPSLLELARKVGTHDKRLSALFREHMGSTVFAYVREARLRKSQELLSDSEMNVQDIADLVGFSSACNFTTAFRQRLGMTPTQYRQKARGE